MGKLVWLVVDGSTVEKLELSVDRGSSEVVDDARDDDDDSRASDDCWCELECDSDVSSRLDVVDVTVSSRDEKTDRDEGSAEDSENDRDSDSSSDDDSDSDSSGELDDDEDDDDDRDSSDDDRGRVSSEDGVSSRDEEDEEDDDEDEEGEVEDDEDDEDEDEGVTLDRGGSVLDTWLDSETEVVSDGTEDERVSETRLSVEGSDMEVEDDISAGSRDSRVSSRVSRGADEVELGEVRTSDKDEVVSDWNDMEEGDTCDVCRVDSRDNADDAEDLEDNNASRSDVGCDRVGEKVDDAKEGVEDVRLLELEEVSRLKIENFIGGIHVVQARQFVP